MTDGLGFFVAAILTLCVFSYLLGDNALYRLAEHLFVAVAVAVNVAVPPLSKLTVVVMFVSGSVPMLAERGEVAIASEVETPAPAPDLGAVVAEGVVVPGRHATLSLAASGIVAEILVEEGATVEAGQPILRLQDAHQRAAVAEAQAALNSAEAQLANLADEVAYNNHDVDDGIRAGLITIEDLCGCRMFGRQFESVRGQYPQLGGRRLVHEVVRRMIDYTVNDLVDASRASLASAAPRSVDEVRSLAQPLLLFSDGVREEHLELKRYLREHLYKHFRVLRMTTKAQRVVRELFDAMFGEVNLMPTEHQDAARRLEAADGETGRARAVADYIAGMTDRFAILEHRRLFNPAERT